LFVRVHEECREEYANKFKSENWNVTTNTKQKRRRLVCEHCASDVVRGDGFSGKYHIIDDGSYFVRDNPENEMPEWARQHNHDPGAGTGLGGRGAARQQRQMQQKQQQKVVHAECYAAYQDASSTKCEHCGEPVCEVEGKFSGKFFDTISGGGTGAVSLEEFAQFMGEAGVGSGANASSGDYSGGNGGAGGSSKDDPRALWQGRKKGEVHSECWAAYKAGLVSGSIGEDGED
jgi:hypothetical protein